MVKKMTKKEEIVKKALYQTCYYKGKCYQIVRTFENGDGTWRYSIKNENECHSQVHESELNDFCL